MCAASATKWARPRVRLDYDHINMLTAPQAQEDHFPQILDWLLNPKAA